jgi:hypothetical protein
MADARELPLWYNHVWLGYIDIKRCRTSRAPFFFDLNHNPIYVDEFCRQTGLKRNTWRQNIRVEKPDGDIVPALPLITPPNSLHSPPRRAPRPAPANPPAAPARPALPAARRREIQEARRSESDGYFAGLFSIARPASQEAREAATRAAAAYLAEVDSRQAAARGTSGARALALVALSELAARPAVEVDEEKICVICHEDLKAGQRLAATDCGHVFCIGCISASLGHNDACPTCRTKEPVVTPLYI